MAFCNCDFKNTFPGISIKFHSNFFPLSSLPPKITHTYIQTLLRQKRSQIWLFRCRIIFPMPQLTPDCDRVIVLSFRPSDGMHFNTLYVIKLIQLIMEIRTSEDYCRSDIYVADYGNVSLCHISKGTPSLVKKFELCAFVSLTNNFCVYIS